MVPGREFCCNAKVSLLTAPSQGMTGMNGSGGLDKICRITEGAKSSLFNSMVCGGLCCRSIYTVGTVEGGGSPKHCRANLPTVPLEDLCILDGD